MSDLEAVSRVVSFKQTPGAGAPRARVGYVDGAIGGTDRVLSLGAHFPDVEFSSVGAEWPDRPGMGLAALIVAADPGDIEGTAARLAARGHDCPIIVALRQADVATTRRLMRAGAADILAAPISEAALALSLERLLSQAEAAGGPSSNSQVIALLKAGGGSGATSVGTQLAVMLATRGPNARVCFADLDLQFGQGALYLDLADAITLTDILGGGAPLREAPLATAIARHSSGARLLASPRELTPMETLSRQDVEGLIAALRRDFATSLLDLPAVWTAWTHQALQLCDRIVMVTQLSVAHINLVKRQLKTLSTQNLESIHLTLVCNQLSAEQQSIVSLKTAEKAIGRAFDVVIPADVKLMNEAIAQGREVSAIRGGSKLVKALDELTALIAPAGAGQPAQRRRLW
jgi:pilus assembly protein CpaE